MQYERQIDKYLLGQMSPVEETSFLNECKTNKELKEEAAMTALLVKAIKKSA
jgi:hypothetical protein